MAIPRPGTSFDGGQLDQRYTRLRRAVCLWWFYHAATVPGGSACVRQAALHGRWRVHRPDHLVLVAVPNRRWIVFRAMMLRADESSGGGDFDRHGWIGLATYIASFFSRHLGLDGNCRHGYRRARGLAARDVIRAIDRAPPCGSRCHGLYILAGSIGGCTEQAT